MPAIQLTLDSPLSEVVDRLLKTCIQPNSAQVAKILHKKDIACVVFEPHPNNAVAATGMGWDGKDPIFTMDDRARKALALVVATEDPILSQWLLEDTYGRVFVFIHTGILMLNHDLNLGFSVVPNSDSSFN